MGALNLLRRWRGEPSLAGPRLLSTFAEAYPHAFFVEVGSNDGEKHDHLRPLILSNPWRGLMVEPVPYVFERLRENYGQLSRVTLANVAVADRDGTMPFYHLGQVADAEAEGLPEWYDAIGSFSRDAVLGHRTHIPDIEARIQETEVRCVRFASLLREHAVERVDLLLVDTEGYDAEIIKQVDLSTTRPALLIFEHFHLPGATRRALHEHLEANGYLTMEEHFDTFCLASDAPSALVRRWRGLKPGLAPVYAEDEER